MPSKLVWTAPQDASVLRLRREGKSWDAIAARLLVSRNAAIERGRRLGARLPPKVKQQRGEDPDRPSLPPGHARSWGTLVRGTVLDGACYPKLPPIGRDRCGVVGEVC